MTTVIPDDPFTCADCCPLKRPPLPPTGGKAQICANRMRESRDEAEHDPPKKAAYTCTKAKPCMFDGEHPQLRFAFCHKSQRSCRCCLQVVNDVNESINLAELPAHQATRKAIEARISYHFGRQFNYSIDHTNITAEQCKIVILSRFACCPSR